MKNSRSKTKKKCYRWPGNDVSLRRETAVVLAGTLEKAVRSSTIFFRGNRFVSNASICWSCTRRPVTEFLRKPLKSTNVSDKQNHLYYLCAHLI